MLNIIDEHTRESLAVHVRRKRNSQDVLHVLGKLFLCHGPPKHIRSENGPEFVADAVHEWLERLDVKTLYIEPGSPWENGYCESFNGKLRDECLSREIFYSRQEAQIVIEQWRIFHNAERPHSSLGYRPPAPRTFLPSSIPAAYAAGRAIQSKTQVHAGF